MRIIYLIFFIFQIINVFSTNKFLTFENKEFQSTKNKIININNYFYLKKYDKFPIIASFSY